MKKWIPRGLAALGASVAITAGGWLVVHKTASGGTRRRPHAPAPDAGQEDAFLNDQSQRSPSRTAIVLRLAQIERAEGDLAGARRYLEEAVAADGSQVDLRLELAIVCSEMGDVAAAEQQNREVLRLMPEQPDALYNLGTIAADRGDTVQARQYWMSAAASGRSSAAAVQSLDGIQHLPAAW